MELLFGLAVLAVVVLIGAAVIFMLHQRRQGTVRAVFRPRRDRGGGASET